MRTIFRIIAMTAVAAGAACASGGRIDQALPASIDPARIEVVEVATGTSGEVLMRGTVNDVEAAAANTRRGELTSTTNTAARGLATIRDGEILVEVAGLPALAFMTLRVNGEQVLFFRTDSGGDAAIKLERSPLARAR